MADAVYVPVKIFGEIVGTALIGNNGEIFLGIDQSRLGRELKGILQSGFAEHLSLGPVYTPIKRKES